MCVRVQVCLKLYGVVSCVERKDYGVSETQCLETKELRNSDL